MKFPRVNLRRIARALIAAAAVAFAVLGYSYLTLPDVRSLSKTNPSSTAFIELRAREARSAGKAVRRVQIWIPYSRVSQHLKRAVLVAEDDAFWEHEGIDVEQLRRSLEVDLAKGSAVRGGSTITQQLAKNLYLSPSRNPLRKIRELIIARRLEAELPKARIFELYLNVIEWGDGIWGAEAASRTYFRTSASSLSPSQAALLAGAIVNPRILNPAHPPARLLRRQRIILSRMGAVEPPAPAPTPPPPPPALPESIIPEPPPPVEPTPETAPDGEPADPADPRP
jgi:monofunctional biosynthetic peptidoglycan transglycosylase